MANSPSSRNHGTPDSALGRARRCAGVDGRGHGRASAVDAADDRMFLWGDGGRSWPWLPISEDRRVGTECVRTCRYRGYTSDYQQNIRITRPERKKTNQK